MVPEEHVRVGAFEPRSRANGPGIRAVIWTQGCSRSCPGCCNPELQSREGGAQVPVADLLAHIENAGVLHGITLTGGEPFEQAQPLAELCRQARRRGLTVVCFTGYSLQELHDAHDSGWTGLLGEIDLLIAGAYLQDQPCEEPLLASTNQKLHFLTGRITSEDLQNLPRAEVIVRDGELHVTGFDAQISERLRVEFGQEEC